MHSGRPLGRELRPAIADCGYRAPLAPRLARSPLEDSPRRGPAHTGPATGSGVRLNPPIPGSGPAAEGQPDPGRDALALPAGLARAEDAGDAAADHRAADPDVRQAGGPRGLPGGARDPPQEDPPDEAQQRPQADELEAVVRGAGDAVGAALAVAREPAHAARGRARTIIRAHPSRSGGRRRAGRALERRHGAAAAFGGMTSASPVSTSSSPRMTTVSS